MGADMEGSAGGRRVTQAHLTQSAGGEGAALRGFQHRARAPRPLILLGLWSPLQTQTRPFQVPDPPHLCAASSDGGPHDARAVRAAILEAGTGTSQTAAAAASLGGRSGYRDKGAVSAGRDGRYRLPRPSVFLQPHLQGRTSTIYFSSQGKHEGEQGLIEMGGGRTTASEVPVDPDDGRDGVPVCLSGARGVLLRTDTVTSRPGHLRPVPCDPPARVSKVIFLSCSST